jgi:hypothetical protein
VSTIKGKVQPSFHCELDTLTVIVRGTDGLRKDLNFTLAIP